MDRKYRYTERGQLKIYNRTVLNSLVLSEGQRLTLLFILDRTVRWQKPGEHISLREFERGAFRRRGGRKLVVTPGTGLSSEQVTLAISELSALGAITAEITATALYYSIVEDWLASGLSDEFSGWSLAENDYSYLEQ